MSETIIALQVTRAGIIISNALVMFILVLYTIVPILGLSFISFVKNINRYQRILGELLRDIGLATFIATLFGVTLSSQLLEYLIPLVLSLIYMAAGTILKELGR